MAIPLVALVSRLAEDIPAVNGRPSSEQYTTAVKGAVADFSLRTGMESVATIAVVAGTATYDLPADFLAQIRMENPFAGTGAGYMLPGGKMYPVSQAWSTEKYVTRGKKITFYPTPTYTLDRTLWYKAGHVLVNNEYPYMTEEMAEIVMVKARADAINLLGVTAAGEAWLYTFAADFEIDKSKQANVYLDVIEAMLADYEKRLAAFKGNTAVVGNFDYFNYEQLMGHY